MQKQGYQEPKNRINTVILSLRKQGSTSPGMESGTQPVILSLRKQGSTLAFMLSLLKISILSLRKQGST